MIKLLFSLRKLTASHNVRNIRFFGRFLAALNDYYVVEAEVRGDQKGGQRLCFPDWAGFRDDTPFSTNFFRNNSVFALTGAIFVFEV